MLNALRPTALLILFVQRLEGNVIMPLVQRRATAMPPALTILAVAGFGVLFGLLGAFPAAPLLLVLIILVRMLWVEDAPRGPRFALRPDQMIHFGAHEAPRPGRRPGRAPVPIAPEPRCRSSGRIL